MSVTRWLNRRGRLALDLCTLKSECLCVEINVACDGGACIGILIIAQHRPVVHTGNLKLYAEPVHHCWALYSLLAGLPEPAVFALKSNSQSTQPRRSHGVKESQALRWQLAHLAVRPDRHYRYITLMGARGTGLVLRSGPGTEFTGLEMSAGGTALPTCTRRSFKNAAPLSTHANPSR